MPAAPTTTDPFTALAEPKRRQVMAALAGAELPVNHLVVALGWPQPQVSKHLGVLRQVGLVAVRRRGRERVYSVNGEGMKSVHDWTNMFAKFWDHQLGQIKAMAEAKAKEQAP